MRRVLREHPTLYPRINGCIDRIKRDVVDAERELRMDTDMERESLSGI